MQTSASGHGVRGCMEDWVAVKELSLSYYIEETILVAIYTPIMGMILSYYFGDTLLTNFCIPIMVT